MIKVTTDYFADDGYIHQSTLAKILYMSPAEFNYSLNAPKEDKEHFRIGTAVHGLLLQPQIFEDLIIEEPEIDGRIETAFKLICDGRADAIKLTSNKTTKRSVDSTGEYDLYEVSAQEYEKLQELKANYPSLLIPNPERMLFKPKKFQAIKKMVQSVKECPDAMTIIDNCVAFEKEETFEYRGLNFKRKQDGVGLNYSFILDLKTALDPKPDAMKKAIEGIDPYYGGHAYAFQAAAYRKMTDCNTYYITAVGNTEPHETYVYQLSEKTLALGESQFNEACDRYIKFSGNFNKKNTIQWI